MESYVEIKEIVVPWNSALYDKFSKYEPDGSHCQWGVMSTGANVILWVKVKVE